MLKNIMASITVAAGVALAAAAPAAAGDSNGNFQVKVGVTGVLTQDKTTSLHALGAGGGDLDLLPTFPDGALTNNTYIPTATLTYYVSKNLAVELFCCFDKVHVDPKDAALKAAIGNTSMAETWAFPPILTAQYHFDGMGAFRPYVGAGFEWIHYFSSNLGGDGLGIGAGGKVKFSDSFGPAVQVGFDYDLGNGWSLGADFKKVWEDTKITWTDAAGNRIVAKHDLDPIFVTVNLGYRFNLSDLFGRRAEPAPLK